MTSPTSGYITISVHNNKERDNIYLSLSKTLYAPGDHVFMISFLEFEGYVHYCPNGLNIYAQDQDNSQVLLWKECDHRHADSYILYSNQVTLSWNRVPSLCSTPGCVRILFTFHPKDITPHRLNSGLYNCSVHDYWRFKPHLHCNMKEECEDGRDETEHCPFSSPICQGWVTIDRKCVRLVSKESLDRFITVEQFSHVKALKFCASLNASVGTPTNSHEINSVFSRFAERVAIGTMSAVVGFSYGELSVPDMYRRSLLNYDKSVIHHTLAADIVYGGNRLCFYIYFLGYRHLRSYPCTTNPSRRSFQYNYYASCEYTPLRTDQDDKRETIHFPSTSVRVRNGIISLSVCPNGQNIHAFLSCYPHNECGQDLPHLCTFLKNSDNVIDSKREDVVRMTSSRAFTCNDGVIRLSYTLVCDFRYDCQDGSDESFCHHFPCKAFACSSGQCVSYSRRCDSVSDCLDDSDELRCINYAHVKTKLNETASPVLITFDRTHSFTVRKMRSNETCPETHYRCPGEYNDCLPVYTRCNGWYDCMGHEDEEGCEDIVCPGFYRCFNSSVCVHVAHMCDGWPHCPQRDDEWLCDMTCPAQCLCQGHAFLCPQPFSAHLFPQLRYLDARGSGMTPSDLIYNHYVVYLSFAHCALSILPAMTMSNLQHLDLGCNDLRLVNMSVFAGLVSLKSLLLRENPIHQLIESSSTTQLHAARTVDLSQTKLTVFDSKALSSLFNTKSLNLSFSSIHTIHPSGFRHTPKLTQLYLDGTPIETFPADVFKPLRNLDILTSQTYKLCCRKILPDHFGLIECDAPKDEISSCEDLLQSGMYRVFLWLISFLSLLGNVLCLVVRVCVQRTVATSGFHVFVTHLSIADLLMGVYIAIIGVADSMFRGRYLFHDGAWKHSVACKLAGFLSLLSCEVSALIIWLITLDRFLVLHFLFGTVRFQKTSAVIVSLITWLVGFTIASIPLLPVTAHWDFFGQTGICIPLPVTRQDFKGKAFSVTVFIVFNFILCVLIATGQAFIYWSVQKNALNTDSTKVSRDLTIARRLISVAVTDFLCWFPIGLCGLLALADVPISGEVNVALAIFVLPLNSALNPFMYTFNMLREKTAKSNKAMLQKWLESHPDLVL